MSSRIASFLALGGLVCTVAAAQSLGDVARKERERREKNKNSGVVVREIPEDEIFEEEPEEEVDSEGGAEGDSEPDETEADGAKASPVPEPIDVAVEPDATEKLDEESRDRRRQEAEWRNRFHEARQRVALAREQKAVWDGVHYVDGVTLVDENGNVVVDSRDDLQHYVSQANQELADAERALKDLEERARRAGVPPGWLR